VGIRGAAPAAVVSFVLAILAGGCGHDAASFTDTLFAPSVDLPVLVAAGDIASCASSGDETTANLLVAVDGMVITLGDNAYEQGSAENYRECYDPTWGRFKDRTLPIPGNHEYETEGAEGYFDNFGDAAGDPSKGYYSYDLAGWHIVALNSNECLQIGGCRFVSPQVRWLKADLAANEDKTCTLAYLHHPRFRSGDVHGSAPEVRPLWEALYEAGADVVLSGHEHNYERFAPQDPSGRADPERGIREFVVGTGGKSHYEIEVPLTNSEVHNAHTYGVLKLTLHPKSYDWLFIPVKGEAFTNSGRGRCH
jgi:acid phosphatase type 7